IEGITSSQWATSGSDISYTAGNVGIGTASPQGALTIATGQGMNLILSDSDDTSSPIFTMRTSNGIYPAMFISSQDLHIGGGYTSYGDDVVDIILGPSNNVGIGTMSPDEKLDVNGKIAIYRDTGVPQILFNSAEAGYEKWSINAQDDGSFRVSEHVGTESYVMTFLSTGYVGIGTASPETILQINHSSIDDTISTDHVLSLTRNSAARIAKAYFSVGKYEATSSNGRSRLDLSLRKDIEDIGSSPVIQTWLANGNVGIGTTNPSA
ncbi:unnamed protein product, partial [marine sediment metagenome]